MQKYVQNMRCRLSLFYIKKFRQNRRNFRKNYNQAITYIPKNKKCLKIDFDAN